MAELKPFDTVALIAPPATKEAVPETKLEDKGTTEQAAEKSETEETRSMEIHYNVTEPSRKELN